MQDSPTKLRVRVPASTSNLGPGFDLLGLALSLFLDVEAQPLAKGQANELTRTGPMALELAGVTQDLTQLAYELAAKRFKIEQCYRFIQSSDIPTSRGLGSSGAAICAGLLLARDACKQTISIQELISIGIELEGHPDNVVASLLGGLTLCQSNSPKEAPTLVQPELHSSIGFSVIWSDAQLPTKEARKALPAQVPFAHAVENPGRLAFLLEGLRTGRPELLRAGSVDRLHVPYRLPLIPGSEATLESARQAGAWLASISGSGSTLIALGPKAGMQAIAGAMQTELSKHAENVQTRLLEAVFGTPQVERLAED